MNSLSRLIPFTSVALLIFASSAGPATVHADRKLGKTAKIKRWGYSIRAPKDWISMPEQPGTTKVVGSWKPDQKIVERKWDEASVGCELRIVRFAMKGATTGDEADKKKQKEEEENRRRFKRFLGADKARTLEEYIDKQYEGARKRSIPKDISAGSGKKKLKGKLLEFTSGRSFVALAMFERDGIEWGICYESPEDWYAKEWKKCFMKSIQSFRLFKPTGGSVVVRPGVAKKNLSPKEKRERIKSQIAGNPGWWALDTKNYVFLTNSKNKGFIRTLGREIEVLRAKVYEKMFPPSKKVTAISIVRVFSDESEYYQYGGPRGSAGYWSSAKEELVLFEGFSSMSKSKSDANTKSVMYHEAFHQYIYYAAGDVAPHSWFNEGHGDFFAGASIRGTKVAFKKFNWRVAFLKRHLQRKKGLIPIRSLVRLPQSEYYSNAGLKYSQGWALVYYLRHVTKNKKWKGIPDRYFKHLRDNLAAFKKSKADSDDTGGESIPGIPGVKVYNFEDSEKVDAILEAAIDKGFQGVDYEKLDKAFQAWVKGIT